MAISLILSLCAAYMAEPAHAEDDDPYSPANMGYWSGTVTINVQGTYAYSDYPQSGSYQGTSIFTVENASGFRMGDFEAGEPDPELGQPGSIRLTSQDYTETATFTDPDCSETVHIGPSNGHYTSFGWWQDVDTKEWLISTRVPLDNSDIDYSNDEDHRCGWGQRDAYYGPLTWCRNGWSNPGSQMYLEGVEPQMVTEEIDGEQVTHLVQRGTATQAGGCQDPDVQGSYTAEFDLAFTEVPVAECAGPVHSRWDSFDAGFKPLATEFRFEVDTAWCETITGATAVKSVTPQGTTLQSPFQAVIAAEIREFFAYHDDWDHDETSYQVDGETVTSSGAVKSCFGIPLIGKIKWIKEFGQSLKFAAKLIDRIGGGKLAFLANRVAGAVEKAALAFKAAMRVGGKRLKKIAQGLVNGVGDLLTLMSDRKQTNLLLATVGVLADWQSSDPRARDFLKDLAVDKGSALIREPDMLVKLLSDKLVCFEVWKPQIRQTLTQQEDGQWGAGEFIDVAWDLPLWQVARTTVQ